jgi:hypothetical protein
MPTPGSGIAEAARRARLGALLFVVACGGETPEPPSPRGFGQVRVATVVDLGGPGTDLTTIDATFDRADARTECQIAAHGACQVMDCVGSASTRPDAGQLTLASGDSGFMQVLLPDASGTYSFGDEAGIFEPGDAINVIFAGGEVPAFEVNGVFPEPLVITEPVVPSGSDPYPVVRGSDLTIRWTGGIAGTTFSLSQDTLSPTVLRCSVPAERGTLTVLASALAALDPGRLDLRTMTATSVATGSYDVALVLIAAALNADGQGVSLTVQP